jgi:cold-inducible RNA-binding protein
MGSKVFVGNLDFRTSPEQVRELFSQAGEIQDVFFPMDRDTGRPRGFAFVTFNSDSAATDAIQRFNGQELDGRPLRVNPAEDRPDRAGGGGFNRGGGGQRGGGGGGGDRFGGGGKPKGSRRNIRAKKRGL